MTYFFYWIFSSLLLILWLSRICHDQPLWPKFKSSTNVKTCFCEGWTCRRGNSHNSTCPAWMDQVLSWYWNTCTATKFELNFKVMLSLLFASPVWKVFFRKLFSVFEQKPALLKHPDAWCTGSGSLTDKVSSAAYQSRAEQRSASHPSHHDLRSTDVHLNLRTGTVPWNTGVRMHN